MSALQKKLAWRAVWARALAFDVLLGVETGIRAHDKQLDAVGDSRGEGVLYDHSPWTTLPRALRLAGVRPDGYSFVDIGCGKGKILLSALQYPFSSVIGVEYSPRLCTIAERNLAVARLLRRRCAKTKINCTDATLFPVPAGPCVFFFYNPFKERIMRIVLDNIVQSHKASRRSIYMIFYGVPNVQTMIDALQRDSGAKIAARGTGTAGKKKLFVFELPQG